MTRRYFLPDTIHFLGVRLMAAALCILPMTVGAQAIQGGYCGVTVVSGSLSGPAGTSVTVRADCPNAATESVWLLRDYSGSAVVRRPLGNGRQVTVSIPSSNGASQRRVAELELLAKTPLGVHGVSLVLDRVPSAEAHCRTLTLTPGNPYPAVGFPVVDRQVTVSADCPAGTTVQRFSAASCEVGAQTPVVATPSFVLPRLGVAPNAARTYSPQAVVSTECYWPTTSDDRSTDGFRILNASGGTGPRIAFHFFSRFQFPGAGAPATGTPGTPTNVTAVAGNGQATVSFQAPAQDGGSAITGYVVSVTPGGMTVNTTASPVTITSLTNGQAYTFQVAARNARGLGVASTPSAPVTPQADPVPPNGPLWARAITSGDYFSCAITDPEGKVMCWGNNSFGELGDGTNLNRHHAAPVSQLSQVMAISAGSFSTCAVEVGIIRCWGRNDSGQLGDGTTQDRSTPVSVPLEAMGGPAFDVAVGDDHACAILLDGRVKCWGLNNTGQLGDGSLNDSRRPVLVQGLDSVVSLAAGSRHTCATTRQGLVYCWGMNSSGQIGNGTNEAFVTTPQVVRGAYTAAFPVVAAAGGHACGLDSAGIFCWGQGGSGALGDNSGGNSRVAVRAHTSMTGWLDIKAAASATCALAPDSFLYCWGHNRSGRLASGDTTDLYVPTRTATLGQVGDFGIGLDHACAIVGAAPVNRGIVQCWGSNVAGQLGDGSSADSLWPVEVEVGASAPVYTRSATWWNPSEGGWGIFTVDQGNALAVGWFTYDEDGEPTWFLVPSLTPTTPNQTRRYRGRILQFTGVPLALISGTAANPGVDRGLADLDFSSDGTLDFLVTTGNLSQHKRLSRFPFGNRQLVCTPSPGPRAGLTNFSDLWWSPTSSGWGVHMSHVDSTLYASWYTYDPDGEAVFYIAALTGSSPTQFSGPVVRQRNGTPYPLINGQPASPGSTVVGSATMQFQNGENALFGYTLGNVTQTKSLQRFVFGNTPEACKAVPAG